MHLIYSSNRYALLADRYGNAELIDANGTDRHLSSRKSSEALDVVRQFQAASLDGKLSASQMTAIDLFFEGFRRT